MPTTCPAKFWPEIVDLRDATFCECSSCRAARVARVDAFAAAVVARDGLRRTNPSVYPPMSPDAVEDVTRASSAATRITRKR